METFGRGCFYVILGIIGLLFLSFILQSQINIPIFIAIPLVALAFFVASKKTNSGGGDAGGYQDTSGNAGNDESE